MLPHLQPSNQYISVVVQGPVIGRSSDPPDQRWTWSALESARKILPGAEIILSTWKGSDLMDLVADCILENEDPGATAYYNSEAQNNVNRQIISTREGIKASSRPFVLKIRSETVIAHDGFRKYFSRYPQRCSSQVVRERVVACTIGSYIPREVYFHSCYDPSDWFYFGKREDVLDIWDIPLAPEPETSLWFLTHPFPNGVQECRIKMRYANEQYVWVTFLRKHHPVAFDSFWEARDDAVRASEESLAANLILISPRQAGLHSLKYPVSYTYGMIDHIRQGCYTHQHWKVLYEHFCNKRSLHPAVWYPPFFRCVRTAAKAYRWIKC